MGTELIPAGAPEDPAPDLDSLGPLTDREYAFFERILAGESPIEAYKAAYDCTTWRIGRIMKQAMALLEEKRIAANIAAARYYGLSPTDLSKASHMRQLERQREIALRAGNHGAALNAEIARGKAVGLYAEQAPASAPFDPLRILRELAKISEALARMKAQEYNIPWEEVTSQPAAASAPPSSPVSREADDIEPVESEPDDDSPDDLD
jgi:hypothetical protein